MINCGQYCTDCINLSHGNRRIDAEGNGSSGIILLGDSPWKTEIEAGHNFHGPAGQLLNRMLERLGIKRDSLTITNSIQCQPPHLGWTDHPAKFPEAISALRQCEPYLKETLDRVKPKVIVALGNVAMRQAIGNINIAADITQRHAYVHETVYGIPAIPTFHPSFIMQGKHKLEICVMFAIRRAQEVANGSYRESHFNLLLDPPIEDGINYLRNYLSSHNNRISLLMVDIETPESADLDEEDLEEKGLSYHIDRAGFSLDENSGISFPYKQPYIDLLQEALDHADIIAEWADNHFDTRRLSAAGHVIRGRVVSGMWAWHFYQSDLLKGLGFVAPFFYAGPPFKHLHGSQPALYNALDNAVGRACTVGSMEKLAAEGRLDRFLRHCVDADKIYVKMGGMGVKLDMDHFGKFRDRLKVEYRDQVEGLQSQVPDKVKVVKTWKRSPKKIDDDGWTDVKVGSRVERVKAEKVDTGGYRAILPFNPGSPVQIKDLIRSLGLKVPVDRDGETTGAKHLKRFSKYPIFRLIHIAKQRKTLISNYDWQPNSEGRITTCYGWHPSTWRKSSRNYNLQVIPKRSDLADEFRRSIVAAPGHYLLTSDGSAIEAVLVGYDAGSDSYIRLAKAGLHGWMTAAYHNEPIDLKLPFNELSKRCKIAKKKWPVDYETLKRVGHLCLTGDHEILTSRGWIRLDQYNGYEPVAQWHEGIVQFVEPRAFIQQDFSGQLIHFKGQALDQCVTPNHGMPISIDHTWKTKKIAAENVRTTGDYIPLTGYYTDGDLSPTLTEVQLAVITQADGSINGQTIKVKLKRQRKIDRLISILGTLPHSINKYEGYTTIKFPSYLLGPAADLLNAQKQLTWDCLRLSPASRRIFLDEVPFWDGSHSTGPTHKRVQYNTAIERNAIIVQSLAHLDCQQALMRYTTIGSKRYWTVSFNKRRFAYVGPIKREKVDYTGPVYCLTVPNGYFITRHNDRISVTGNSNYLGTPYRIYEEYPEEFASPVAAGILQNFYFSTPPGREVRQWQSRVMQEAHKRNYLDNHFNYRHYFYSVFKKDSKSKEWTIDHDGDAKRAVAFIPQSDASAIQTEVVLRLAEGYEMMLEYLRLIIHDELVLEVPEDDIEVAATNLHTEMVRPIPELPLKDGSYLSIGAETKFGRNLAAYHPETNVDGMREMIVEENVA